MSSDSPTVQKERPMSGNPFTASVTYQDPKAALDWLARAFGFELTMLIASPDDEHVLHAEMSFGGRGQIGRASCRERVEIEVVAEDLEENATYKTKRSTGRHEK